MEKTVIVQVYKLYNKPIIFRANLYDFMPEPCRELGENKAPKYRLHYYHITKLLLNLPKYCKKINHHYQIIQSEWDFRIFKRIFKKNIFVIIKIDNLIYKWYGCLTINNVNNKVIDY